ncbi:MAG: cell division protein ZapA [Bdellovibrionales bacterium]
MAKIAITLYGREYFVNCDPGEESRLRDVVKYVESRMQKVAEKAGTTVTDPKLFMLTCLGLADEILEHRQSTDRALRMEEEIMVAAVDHLQARITHIANQVGRA